MKNFSYVDILLIIPTILLVVVTLYNSLRNLVQNFSREEQTIIDAMEKLKHEIPNKIFYLRIRHLLPAFISELYGPVLLGVAPTVGNLSYQYDSPTREFNKPNTTLIKSRYIIKRLFDISVSLLLIISVLSWLVPLIGLLIRLESSGPVFFVQLRTGKYGRPFRCIKFRTMRHRTDFKKFEEVAKTDTRVTRVGAFLRRTNLDELPQFLNVLVGDMSIVGPRPYPIAHDVRLWYTVQHYQSRYSIKPGITGLAQIKITGETMKSRIKYDLLYIKRQSFLLDMLICWWTVKRMIIGDEHSW